MTTSSEIGLYRVFQKPILCDGSYGETVKGASIDVSPYEITYVGL